MDELLLPPTTSATQLVTYSMCPRRFALSYVYGVEPEFRSTALVMGSCLHSAIGWFFEEKIAGRVADVSDVEEVFSADLAAAIAVPKIRWKQATPESLEADGRRYLRLYLESHWDLPVESVEQPFTVSLADPETGEVVGRPLKGFFDLVLAKTGRVVELKSSSRGYDPFDLVRHLQVGAYAFAWNQMHGGPSQIDVHVIVKLKKEPRVETYNVERGEADTRWWLQAAWAIETAIALHRFPPAPSPMCRECEYEKTCAAWVSDAPPPVAPAEARLLRVIDDRANAFAADL